jgi:phenylalanyl-tRNA synthetase alpha subunit
MDASRETNEDITEEFLDKKIRRARNLDDLLEKIVEEREKAREEREGGLKDRDVVAGERKEAVITKEEEKVEQKKEVEKAVVKEGNEVEKKTEAVKKVTESEERAAAERGISIPSTSASEGASFALEFTRFKLRWKIAQGGEGYCKTIHSPLEVETLFLEGEYSENLVV